jgi:NCAIR mutase (PurE)-related protein
MVGTFQGGGSGVASKKRIQEVLEAVKGGRMTVKAAMEALKKIPFEKVTFAHIDHHRALRRGFPEVVFCQGKTIHQAVTIIKKIAADHSSFLATRVDPEMARAVGEKIPGLEYHPVAKVLHGPLTKRAKGGPMVLVVSAGTSDIPVAEEAAVTLEVMGRRVERVFDVGVAGLHRLLGYWEKLRRARVIIVVAGMEGALASVIGGMVDKPVIAVPTSVGYGASFGGVTALLAMLNSCAAGVTVVNIDNGFGAGYAASLMISGPAKALGRGKST